MSDSTFFLKAKNLPPKPFSYTPVRNKQQKQQMELRSSKPVKQNLPLMDFEPMDDSYFCQSCLKKNALKRCPNCQNKWFCDDCFVQIHSIGKFQFHTPISPLQNREQDQPNKYSTSTASRKKLKFEQIQGAMIAQNPNNLQKKQLDFLSEIRLKMMSDDLRQNYAQVDKQIENKFNHITSEIKNRVSIIKIELQEKLNRQLESLSIIFKKKQDVTNSGIKPNKSEKQINLFSPAKDAKDNDVANTKEIRQNYYHASKHKSFYNKKNMDQVTQSIVFEDSKPLIITIKPNQQLIAEFDRLVQKLEIKKIISREKKEQSRIALKSTIGKSMILQQSSKFANASQKCISIVHNQSYVDQKSKVLHRNILQASNHQSSIIESRNSKSKGKNNIDGKNNKRCSFNLNQENVFYMPEDTKMFRNPSQKFIFLNQNQKRVKRGIGRMFN